jgi:hypothetical protein
MPSVAEPGKALLIAVCSFVRAARSVRGCCVSVTNKPIPKDADVLVTIDDTTDLTGLARAGRRLKGLLKPSTLAPTSSSLMRTGCYLGRSCQYRECHPRVACLAQHCGRRAHLNDDLHVVTLSKELLAAPMTFGQTLSVASRCRLMSKHYC